MNDLIIKVNDFYPPSFLLSLLHPDLGGAGGGDSFLGVDKGSRYEQNRECLEVKVDYVLMDSWFTSEAFVSEEVQTTEAALQRCSD